MNPEKEIINWWLNQQGFFTISSIKAPQNKEIEILAIRIKDKKVEKIIHVEIYCSISSVDTMRPKEYLQKFEDKAIVNTLKKTIKEHVGFDSNYEKVLVLGHTSRLGEFQKLKGIKVHLFENILSDVLVNLGKQNYRNEIIRTLQLMKYLTLSNPKKLAKLVEDEGKNKIMKLNTREEFLKALTKQKEVRRIMAKNRFESFILEVLRNSSVNRPETLAPRLLDGVISSKSRKRFIHTLLEHKSVKIKKQPKKKERSLDYFFKKSK